MSCIIKKKYTIILFIYFLPFLTYSANIKFTPPEGWVSKKVTGLQEYWHHPKNKKISMAILSSVSKEKFKVINNEEQNKFIETMQKTRNSIFQSFGIQDYKFIKSDFKFANNGFKLHLQGRYLSSKKENVWFKEIQVYDQNNFSQITLSYPASFHEKVEEASHKWLSGFRTL